MRKKNEKLTSMDSSFGLYHTRICILVVYKLDLGGLIAYQLPVELFVQLTMTETAHKLYLKEAPNRA